MIPEIINPIIRQLSDAIPVEDGTDVELSEEQKAAIAIMSGVPYDTVYEKGKLTFTTVPCGIVRMGNQWQVYYKKENREKSWRLDSGGT